jgi:hypothetical protein
MSLATPVMLFTDLSTKHLIHLTLLSNSLHPAQILLFLQLFPSQCFWTCLSPKLILPMSVIDFFLMILALKKWTNKKTICFSLLLTSYFYFKDHTLVTYYIGKRDQLLNLGHNHRSNTLTSSKVLSPILPPLFPWALRISLSPVPAPCRT